MIRRTRASTGSGMLERSPCCFAQAATPKRLAGSGHAEAARGGCGFKPAVEPRKTAIVFVSIAKHGESNWSAIYVNTLA